MDALSYIVLFVVLVLGVIVLRLALPKTQRNGRSEVGTVEREVRKLMSETPVGFYETDHYGIVQYVNEREIAMRGIPAESILGRPCWDFVPDALQARMREDTVHKLSGNRALVPYH